MSALRSRRIRRSTRSRLRAARSPGGKWRRRAHRCSRKFHSNWAEKTQTSFSPTVMTGLPVSCHTNREEIFGPVITITPFDNEEEVIGYANDTDYGLASSVWTQNLNRAHRVAEQIHTGTVWVNCWLVRDLRVPFGGMKASGVGREGGEEALRFFTEAKNICIAK